MTGDYWIDLIYKGDEEIQRLEALAKPDDAEVEILKKISEEPKNLDFQFELVGLLVNKNRLEECVPKLLDMIAADKKWKEKAAQT